MRGETISEKSVWGEALEETLGKEEGGKMAKLAGEKEAKDLLKRNTDLALKEGAFGLPWMVCHNERGEREAYWVSCSVLAGVFFICLCRTWSG